MFRILLGAFFGLSMMGMAGTAHAIIIDGTSTNVTIVGTGATDGSITAYDDEASTPPLNAAPSPSIFNNEILKVSNDTLETSDPIDMWDLPIYTIGGQTYLRLIFDSQETGSGNYQINITSLEIVVSDDGDSFGLGTTVWAFDSVADADGAIILNPDGTGGTTATTDPTESPLGNGADFALLISTDIFDGLGITGADDFYLSTYQIFSDNGKDEWVFQGFVGDEISYLCGGGPEGTPEDCSIGTTPTTTPVPEPATMGLFAIGLAGFGVMTRRRRKQGEAA